MIVKRSSSWSGKLRGNVNCRRTVYPGHCFKKLSLLNVSKSLGPDSMHTHFLKNSCTEIRNLVNVFVKR